MLIDICMGWEWVTCHF